DDHDRQIAVRESLAGALRATGELELCRATLLEATDMLRPDEVAKRVSLTALCAAVEHWQGRHDEAHRRLLRALDDLPARDTVEAATLLIELAIDGMYIGGDELARTLEVGEEALEAARTVADPGLIAHAASVLSLAKAAV